MDSTHRKYLRKLNSQQKHTLRLIHNKNRFYHSKKLFESWEIVNVYKLNLLNAAVFMHKIKTRTVRYHSLKKLTSLLIHIQHAFQVGTAENHKSNYINVDFKFPFEVQQFGTTGSEVRKKKFNFLVFLKLG